MKKHISQQEQEDTNYSKTSALGNTYFYDIDGDEYWYDENGKKHYTRTEG